MKVTWVKLEYPGIPTIHRLFLQINYYYCVSVWKNVYFLSVIPSASLFILVRWNNVCLHASIHTAQHLIGCSSRIVLAAVLSWPALWPMPANHSWGCTVMTTKKTSNRSGRFILRFNRELLFTVAIKVFAISLILNIVFFNLNIIQGLA